MTGLHGMRSAPWHGRSKNPENRRRAMKTLGIETPAQKRESAERSRAFNAWIGSVTDAEIARNCQFPAAPSKRR